MTGIGGAARSLGTRKHHITLETLEGFKVPGAIVSTEIANLAAPLLFSLQTQEDLGIVIPLVAGTVTSKISGCTFYAVRCRRNRLLGLRLHPGDYMDDGETIPVSLMSAQVAMTDDYHHHPSRTSRSPHNQERIRWKDWRLADRAVNDTMDDPVNNPGRGARILYDELGRYVMSSDTGNGGNSPGEPDLEETLEGVDEDDGDFWKLTGDSLIRHHVIPRFDSYSPGNHILEMPVDVSRLQETNLRRQT
eukprot:s980_g12.t1